MIDALSRFHFIRPAALLLIPIAWAVWQFWRRRADPLRGWRMQMDPALLEPWSSVAVADAIWESVAC